MSKKDNIQTNNFTDIQAAAMAAMNFGNRAIRQKNGLYGVTSGIDIIDRKLGGFQKSNLMIVAGRSAMGKTAFAANIAYNAAIAYKKNRVIGIPHSKNRGAVVGFFSIEMSSEKLVNRILSAQTGISNVDLNRGNLTQEDFNTFSKVTNELQDLPLIINDYAEISIAEIKEQARNLHKNQGLGLLIVDCLQLIKYDYSPIPKNQKFSAIIRELKELAMELEIPIVALSQISSNSETIDSNRPLLSDLYDYGSIEEHADMVTFIHRAEYYHNLQEPDAGTPEHMRWLEDREFLQDHAEFIVAKNRLGPTGIIELQFEAEITKFSDRPMSPDYQAEKH